MSVGVAFGHTTVNAFRDAMYPSVIVSCSGHISVRPGGIDFPIVGGVHRFVADLFIGVVERGDNLDGHDLTGQFGGYKVLRFISLPVAENRQQRVSDVRGPLTG